MSVIAPPAAEVVPADEGPADGDGRRSVPGLRTLGSIVGALVVFGLLLLARGENPLEAYEAMFATITRDRDSLGDVLLRATPYLMAALAAAIPARAGLFNIGGEGQILLGAIGAMAAANILGGEMPAAITLPAMAIGGMVGGAMWALTPALLRQYTRTNEAISTLLLNYVAVLVLAWFVFGRWQDPASFGFPRSRSFLDNERLPIVFGSRVNLGVVIAVVVAVVVWALLKHTAWGFRLGVLGGNPEAARRAGLHVDRLAVGALLAGGAVAGLGGMLHVSGVEGQLRPAMMEGYGYTGILAAWMVHHHPVKAIASSVLLAAIAIGGNGLKIELGLSAASVNILMALILLAILGWGRPAGAGS